MEAKRPQFHRWGSSLIILLRRFLVDVTVFLDQPVSERLEKEINRRKWKQKVHNFADQSSFVQRTTFFVDAAVSWANLGVKDWKRTEEERQKEMEAKNLQYLRLIFFSSSSFVQKYKKKFCRKNPVNFRTQEQIETEVPTEW